jgi:hypothetical protein
MSDHISWSLSCSIFVIFLVKNLMLSRGKLKDFCSSSFASISFIILSSFFLLYGILDNSSCLLLKQKQYHSTTDLYFIILLTMAYIINELSEVHIICSRGLLWIFFLFLKILYFLITLHKYRNSIFTGHMLKVVGLMYLYFYLTQHFNFSFHKEMIWNCFMKILSSRFKHILAWLSTEQLSTTPKYHLSVTTFKIMCFGLNRTLHFQNM